MTSYEMSQVRNCRAANANMPLDYETEAVVAEVMIGWSRAEVAATVADGVSDADREAISQTIETEGLGCSAEQCEAWLLTKCRGIVEEQCDR